MFYRMPIDSSDVLSWFAACSSHRFIWKLCYKPNRYLDFASKAPCRTIRAASALIHLSNNSHYVALLIWENLPGLNQKTLHTQSALTCLCFRESRTSSVFTNNEVLFKVKSKGAYKGSPLLSLTERPIMRWGTWPSRDLPKSRQNMSH